MSVLVVSAAALLLVDQATKYLVRNCLHEGRAGWRISFFEIKRVTSVSRIPASSRDRSRLLGLWTVVLVGIALQVHYGSHFRGELAQLALGAASGGATGNLLDQLRQRGVVDFVKIGAWPVFNVADAGITCGVLTAVWCML